MIPVMDAPAIDTTPPMAERLFALLLASGRAFTLLPDGSIQVPAAAATDMQAASRDGSQASRESRESRVTLPVTGVTVPVTDGVTPDSARSQAVVTLPVTAPVTPHACERKRPLTAEQQAVLALFAERPELDADYVSQRLGITRRAAYNRLQRLVASDEPVTLDTMGHYRLAHQTQTRTRALDTAAVPVESATQVDMAVTTTAKTRLPENMDTAEGEGTSLLSGISRRRSKALRSMHGETGFKNHDTRITSETECSNSYLLRSKVTEPEREARGAESNAHTHTRTRTRREGTGVRGVTDRTHGTQGARGNHVTASRQPSGALYPPPKTPPPLQRHQSPPPGIGRFDEDDDDDLGAWG